MPLRHTLPLSGLRSRVTLPPAHHESSHLPSPARSSSQMSTEWHDNAYHQPTQAEYDVGSSPDTRGFKHPHLEYHAQDVAPRHHQMPSPAPTNFPSSQSPCPPGPSPARSQTHVRSISRMSDASAVAYETGQRRASDRILSEVDILTSKVDSVIEHLAILQSESEGKQSETQVPPTKEEVEKVVETTMRTILQEFGQTMIHKIDEKLNFTVTRTAQFTAQAVWSGLKPALDRLGDRIAPATDPTPLDDVVARLEQALGRVNDHQQLERRLDQLSDSIAWLKTREEAKVQAELQAPPTPPSSQPMSVEEGRQIRDTVEESLRRVTELKEQLVPTEPPATASQIKLILNEISIWKQEMEEARSRDDAARDMAFSSCHELLVAARPSSLEAVKHDEDVNLASMALISLGDEVSPLVESSATTKALPRADAEMGSYVWIPSLQPDAATSEEDDNMEGDTEGNASLVNTLQAAGVDDLSATVDNRTSDRPESTTLVAELAAAPDPRDSLESSGSPSTEQPSPVRPKRRAKHSKKKKPAANKSKARSARIPKEKIVAQTLAAFTVNHARNKTESKRSSVEPGSTNSSGAGPIASLQEQPAKDQRGKQRGQASQRLQVPVATAPRRSARHRQAPERYGSTPPSAEPTSTQPMTALPTLKICNSSDAAPKVVITPLSPMPVSQRIDGPAQPSSSGPQPASQPEQVHGPRDRHPSPAPNPSDSQPDLDLGLLRAQHGLRPKPRPSAPSPASQPGSLSQRASRSKAGLSTASQAHSTSTSDFRHVEAQPCSNDAQNSCGQEDRMLAHHKINPRGRPIAGNSDRPEHIPSPPFSQARHQPAPLAASGYDDLDISTPVTIGGQPVLSQASAGPRAQPEPSGFQPTASQPYEGYDSEASLYTLPW